MKTWLALAPRALLSTVLFLMAQPALAQAPSDRQALVDQAQSAFAAKNWPAAIAALNQLVASDPQWKYFEQLGDAELNGGDYEAALAAYNHGVERAEANGAGDAAARTAIGAMLTNEGNALLKLRRNADAIAAYTRAAALDPHPARAYFNLCATEYNTGDVDGALSACDKAIEADPTKADAYFIKGSLLIAQSTTSADGKVSAPRGTVDALRKYLELEPTGAHAGDVRQMLAYVGAAAAN